MSNTRPLFYSALLLTGVNLLLRAVGTSYQVYISNQIGASGIGLLQLVMSVGAFAMIAGMAGIRTGTMYLTAEELGNNRRSNVVWVLSGCILYSILCSGTIAVILYSLSPWIAENWIGDIRVINGLRLYAAFLPVVCLAGVMSGYFTAANRIGTLAAVEVAEQLVSMVITIAVLSQWAGTDPAKACQSVIIGSSLGAVLTLVCLVYLRLRENSYSGGKIPVRNRILQAAMPLASADVLKSGINTVENLMVPKRLTLHTASINPLAEFGIVTGMVFPVIMFPACILFGLAELLIPELARCNASGNSARIRHLVQRSIKVSFLYGILFGGMIGIWAESLSLTLYGARDAERYMKLYAVLLPFLYCDCLTDAMTKGLGQQKICVRYNIITSGLDVLLLFILLPELGMDGYFISFTVTHILNFLLSLNRLMRISGYHLPFHFPALSLAAAGLALLLSCKVSGAAGQGISYCICLFCFLALFQVISKEDLLWIYHLCIPQTKDTKTSKSRSFS